MRFVPAELGKGWLDWRRKRFWAWVLLAFYTFTGFVIVPWLARDAIVEQTRAQLGLASRLDDVDFNPFALSARLEGFEVDDGAGNPLARFDELYANFQLSSAFRRAWTFDEIRLTNPTVHVERNEAGVINLTALVPKKPAEESSPPSDIVRLVLHEIVLQGGRVEVSDRAARTPFETSLGPIDVALHDLSTLPDESGRQTVSVVTERGGRLEFSGDLGVQPFHADGHATMTWMTLSKLSSYLPHELGLAIAEGKAKLVFDYALARSAEGMSARVENLALTLEELKVATEDTEPRSLIGLAKLDVTGGAVDWRARKVAIAGVVLASPDLALWRDADGRFTWARWTDEPAPSQAGQTAGAPPSPQAEPPWSVSLARLAIEHGTMRFDDRAIDPAGQIVIENIDASIENLSLADDAEFPFELSLAVQGGGTLASRGVVTAFSDVRVKATSRLEGLELAPVRPYLASLAAIDLESGRITLDGELESAPDESFAYDGKLAVSDLSFVTGPDRTRLVAWKELTLDGIDIGLDARSAEIASIRLDRAYANVHIARDGTLNLAQIGKSEAAPSVPESEGAEMEQGETGSAPWRFKLGRLEVSKGEMSYLDENLPIPFTIAIRDLDGALSAFDSTSRAPARLELEGQVGEFGAARLDVSMQPMDPTRNTTFDGVFENLALPDASPYSIRFAGHRIASGKLDLHNTYTVREGRMNGNHDIVLRDFALGEKVDYPDALDLPFGLAISLLKGPDGNIDVELPIEGDVNDPQFRIGGVIVKALVNLLTKLVTSPFRLLGSLVGLGDDASLDAVEFRPGHADLAPPEREKLVKLAQALAQRPQLRLKIPGVVDREADGAALREAQVGARVEQQLAGGDQSARRGVVEQLWLAQSGGVALDELRAKYTSAPQEGEKPVLDEIEYIQALQRDLVAAEPLASGALDAMAAARSAAVHDAIVAGAIDASRLETTPAEDVKANEDGVVTMKLVLDAP